MSTIHRSDTVRADRRLWARLRGAWATQLELHERVMLSRQPWLEDHLHWSFDGEEWHLHGHLPPARGGRVPSVTGEGWCPAQRT